MAWKLDDAFKAIGNGLQQLTVTTAQLLIDVGLAMVPTVSRPRWRGHRLVVSDVHTPFALRALLYGVLFVAMLLYYGNREGLANILFYGFPSNEIDRAADLYMPRVGETKDGQANPGGEIIQGLVSQNLTHFLTSAAVVAFALLIVFEAALQLGRCLSRRSDAAYERDVFLCAAAGMILFGLYISLLWGPFLETVGPATAATGWIGQVFYGGWDRYVALWTGPDVPVHLRRMAVIENRHRDWQWMCILLAFFAIPTVLCFARLIAVLAHPADGVRVTAWVGRRHAVYRRLRSRRVRRALFWTVRTAVSAAITVTVAAVVTLLLFWGGVALTSLAATFDPGRNLTIEAINLFPDPGTAQNTQVLSFILRNDTDRSFVIGPRGPLLTIRLPAREECQDLPDFQAHLDEAARVFPDALPWLTEQAGNRSWLPSCKDLRSGGADFQFEVQSIDPAAVAAPRPAAPAAPPAAGAPVAHGARVVNPGMAVLVVAREDGSSPVRVIRCGFRRFTPTIDPRAPNRATELQVRVAVAGSRQTISSGFRTYAGLWLQPNRTIGAYDATLACGSRRDANAQPPAAAAGAERPPAPPARRP